MTIMTMGITGKVGGVTGIAGVLVRSFTLSVSGSNGITTNGTNRIYTLRNNVAPRQLLVDAYDLDGNFIETFGPFADGNVLGYQRLGYVNSNTFVAVSSGITGQVDDIATMTISPNSISVEDNPAETGVVDFDPRNSTTVYAGLRRRGGGGGTILDPEIVIYDVANNTSTDVIQLEASDNEIDGIAVSGGNTFYASDNARNTINQYSSAGDIVRTVDLGRSTSNMTFAGSLLFTRSPGSDVVNVYR